MKPTAILLGLVLLLMAGCGQTIGIETQDIQGNHEIQKLSEKQQSTATLNNHSSSPTEVKNQRDSSSIIRDTREGITPSTLEIPSIGVKADVEQVGLLPNGQMDVPQGMESVAWYEAGTQPGAPGSAVINGHVDSKTGPAVFYHLKKLEKGDKIIVTNKEGEQRTFVVIDKQVYPRNNAPLRKIFGYTHRSQLNLITCTGEFNREARTHEDRLVIYTELEQ
jgi:sortase A